MKVLIFFALSFLPGAWIMFGFPGKEFNLKTKFALAIALSPAILGIQYLILRILNINFADTARWLIGINIPALFLVVYRLRNDRFHFPISRSLFYGLLIFFIIASFLFIPWLMYPAYRTFSWHALMHSDVVYELTRSNIFPEEPELAGNMLSLGWIPHVTFAVVGWLSNWSPLSMYPISNLIMLAVAFVLCYELGRRGLALSLAASLLSAVLMFFGTNIIGALVWAIQNDNRSFQNILGDTRYTPMMGKYNGFETMPMSFAVLIGLLLICVISLKMKVKYFPVYIFIFLVSLGLIYPILFPVGCIVAAVFMVLITSNWMSQAPKYSRKEIISGAASIIIAIVTVLLFLTLVTQDRAKPSFQFEFSGRIAKSLHLVTALFPFYIISAWFLVKSIYHRNGAVLLLAIASGLMMGLYLFFNLDDTEYKYIICATISIAPVCAASIDYYLNHYPRWKLPLTFLITISLVGFHVYSFFLFDKGHIRSLINAPMIDQSSFWISLNSTEKMSAWVNIVKQKTPENAIVVADQSTVHLGPFLDRSLYAPADINGELTAGYSNKNNTLLVGLRGYSESDYEKRMGIVNNLLQGTDETKINAALDTIFSLGRPVVIRFADENAPSLKYLERKGIGSQLFADSENTIWYINDPISAQQALFLPDE
jgi:hypothetical protein